MQFLTLHRDRALWLIEPFPGIITQPSLPIYPGIYANAAMDDVSLDRFQRERHSLRLSASNIAAIAGYHPWKEIQCLLLDLIYQGRRGKLLLERDCDNLCIEMVSEEKAFEDLAAKAGVSVQGALDVKQGKRTVRNIQEASDIKESILKKAKLKNAAEMRELTEGVRNVIDTSYGAHNEDQALNEYERIIGWPVTDRNAEIMIWEFDDEGQPGNVYPLCKREEAVEHVATGIDGKSKDIAADPTPEPKQECLQSGQQEENGIQLKPTQPLSQQHDCRFLSDSKQQSFQHNKPYFCILGSIDGIREELISRKPTEEDDDSFGTRKVIVECKHRMATLPKEPPLYDQIQAVVYMLMHDMDQADIVQVLRTKVTKKRDRRNTGEVTTQEEEKADTTRISVSVHRVALDDVTYRHRFHWENTILPRICQFVQTVYNFRKDDHQRYRLLLAVARKSARDAWKIVFEACPWFEACDTAFRRINRADEMQSTKL